MTLYTAGDGPEVPNVPVTSFVDPVPDLVSTLSNASRGIVDVAALTSKGRIVAGVSADGVTQVLVKAGASVSGEVLRLTVLDGTASDQYGSLGALVGAATGNSVDVTATDTTLGPMAFAVYLAPRDFVRAGTNDSTFASRNVTIQIQSLTTATVSTVPVTIVRPPLALIHGIWSGPGAWTNFGVRVNNQLTRLSDDQRFKTFLINYQSTNSNGFAANADIVKGQIDQDVYAFKNGNNRQSIKVAAVQADIVAHSMGGNLARTMVTRQDYLGDNNYRKGPIHKLITIDTPHLGSEFANLLYNSNALCQAVFGFSGKKVADAVRDLQTTSAVITTTLRQRIYPIVASTIDGVASSAQAVTAQLNFASLLAVPPVLACLNLLPIGGFSAIFGQDTSDLIVSGTSQKATGLGYNGGNPPTTVSNGLIHSVDPWLFSKGPDALSNDISGFFVVGADTVNPQNVINLLNTPVEVGGFGSLLP